MARFGRSVYGPPYGRSNVYEWDKSAISSAACGQVDTVVAHRLRGGGAEDRYQLGESLKLCDFYFFILLLFYLFY